MQGPPQDFENSQVAGPGGGSLAAHDLLQAGNLQGIPPERNKRTLLCYREQQGESFIPVCDSTRF